MKVLDAFLFVHHGKIDGLKKGIIKLGVEGGSIRWLALILFMKSELPTVRFTPLGNSKFCFIKSLFDLKVFWHLIRLENKSHCLDDLSSKLFKIDS